jgi:hypothetical protein
MMLGQDETLVDGEQPEGDPEVEENDQEALELFEGSLFECVLLWDREALIRHGQDLPDY